MNTRALVLSCIFLSACVLLHGESIEGTVVVTKTLTKRRVTASLPLYQRGPAVPLIADLHDDPLSFERERVVVYLEGKIAAPPVQATMEQENRRFLQDTLVISAGSRVSFPNRDPVFHNVFSLSKAKNFDLGNYPKGDTRVVTFNQPGVIYVNCHLHPNMAATIVVTPNQWNARVDRDGHFALRDVPPGDYVAVAWHKAAGFFRKQIEVLPGRGASIEFLVPVDGDRESHERESELLPSQAQK
jgi:plastocyanin